MHCCITGLRLYHKPVACKFFVHPEFYTLGIRESSSLITAMYNGAVPLDKTVFRLCFAVILRHFRILHPDVYTPPYEPKAMTELSVIDFSEEVTAAYHIQAWASSQIGVKVAELTECTARALMEGVSHDSTSVVTGVINSLPTSLSQQLYSWAETASRLYQNLLDMFFSIHDIEHILRVCLHLAALEAPLEEEPPETYALMGVRVDRLILQRSNLIKTVVELPNYHFSPSERRLIKLLSQRTPRPVNNTSLDSPLVDSGELKSRLSKLRGKI